MAEPERIAYCIDTCHVYGVVQAYVPVTTKQVVAFQALKPDGSWARIVDVRVRVNLADS